MAADTRMVKPLISLVSGTWNRLPLLQKMITSFRADMLRGIEYEIVICDGGSTDGTLEWLRTQTDVILIEHGELRGAIRAFTEAANKSTGEYVILANDDIVFHAGSILRALSYLQDTPSCGAVGMADNRPVPPFHDENTYKVLHMPGVKDGKSISLIYAQVGVFRAWLGHKIGWWLGKNNEMAQSRVYGGDNFLSAKIWEMGYTVDKVEGCAVTDFVAEDELRLINRAQGQIANMSDSQVYYSLWNNKVGGPMVSPYPTMPQQNRPSVRVLYLPIYEPGWEIQKRTKRGLREALQRYRTPAGWGVTVAEFDYMGVPAAELESRLLLLAESFQPHIILTQIQAPKPLTANMLGKLRSRHPYAHVINWNGDYAYGGLTSDEMMLLLRRVDLQLCINGTALETYARAGIKAVYWQIGFEPVDEMLPDVVAYDVVWVANAYCESRRKLGKQLMEWGAEYGFSVGLYGSGWGNDAAGNSLYDFTQTHAINRAAKIAIGTNEYPDAYGFFSNRVIETMAAGGCLYAQQTIPGLEALTGLQPGKHYAEWSDITALETTLAYYLNANQDKERQNIADAGSSFVREHHSFDARVRQLFELIKTHIPARQDPQANSVYLRYVGPMQEEFGIPSRVSEHIRYLYEPGKPLLVDKSDAPYFLAQKLWELIE